MVLCQRRLHHTALTSNVFTRCQRTRDTLTSLQKKIKKMSSKKERRTWEVNCERKLFLLSFTTRGIRSEQNVRRTQTTARAIYVMARKLADHSRQTNDIPRTLQCFTQRFRVMHRGGRKKSATSSSSSRTGGTLVRFRRAEPLNSALARLCHEQT